MQPGAPVRLLFAIAAVAVVMAVMVAVLLATDTVLSIWERLDQLAPWAVGVYLAVLILIAAALAWFLIRLLWWRPQRRKPAAELDRAGLEARLADDSREGIEVGTAQAELEELDRRRGDERLFLALFGETSVGKSALINALAPGASQPSDPRAGTTRSIRAFEWQPPDGLPVRLVDVPGFGKAETPHLSEAAREEAIRAHLVIYVTDGDLTRDQYLELARLLEYRKPLVIALNKADRYSDQELAAIREQVARRLPDSAPTAVVPVSAGGQEEVVVVDANGNERTRRRERPPSTGALVAAIETLLVGETESLRERQEASALRLSADKLEAAERRYRAAAAQALVEKYSRRAVIGALAALTPGSDLVIQGALATKLIHDLCNLYDVTLRQIDLDRFLTLAGSRLRRTTAIVLAVAGNGLKAFPGLGTVAGGLVHAVAYGMIFDSLGHAVAASLHNRGELAPEKAADQFESRLVERDPEQTRRLARLALEHWKSRDEDT